jgi:hypothetical protein
MCKTMQRAIVRQAKREGLPVWAWLLAVGLVSCGAEVDSAPGVCLDTGDETLGDRGLIWRPCDVADYREGVCTYRFLDGTADAPIGVTMPRSECLEG